MKCDSEMEHKSQQPCYDAVIRTHKISIFVILALFIVNI